MKTPGIVIAGTNSGCGKTTISMGIMAALMERGLKVQPFKVGPDYIDPMFHTFITGRASRNLDSWMLTPETVKHLYCTHAREADIAVTEGVMGFYDGYGGTSLEGSTADVAEIIGAPVILVVNGEAMSLSAAALVKGFVEFERESNVRGVIFNRVSGEGHFLLLKQAVETHTGVTVLGYVTKMEETAMESRHLGLVTSEETDDLEGKVLQLARQIGETVNLDKLLAIAGKAVEVTDAPMTLPAPLPERVRIGVARDKAFCFYYQDNLDLLEKLGAELVFFSPMEDEAVPEKLDGLYLGGGYPEIWGQTLEKNHGMRSQVGNLIRQGLPVYAECGGMMYLTESIQRDENSEYQMVGIIPGSSFMTGSLKRFGYVTVCMTADHLLAGKGEEIRGHEFHYSDVSVPREVHTCFQVSKSRDGKVTKQWHCGYRVNQGIAGYPHLHFWSNPDFAKGFVESCLQYRSRPVGTTQE